MKLELGTSFVGILLSLSVMAQTPEVVAVPNPNDFLLDTYTMPSDPIAVSPASVMQNVTPIPSSVDILTEIFGKDAMSLNANKPVVTQTRNFTPIPGMYYPKKAILTKLPDLPPPQATVDRYIKTTIDPVIQQPEYADQMLEAMEKGTTTYFSIPKEVRIKFYPGQAHLSAQALKWIKSFAIKVRQDPRLILEIRVSEENWPLQSKRVGLMLQAVLEQGVSRHQIVVYKTNRAADSVLLGYANMLDQEVKVNKKRQKTISW